MQATTFLGIDVGTTKIAVVVTDGEGNVRAAVSQTHGAGLRTPPGRAEQDAVALLDQTWDAVRQIPPSFRQRIGGIGVTGQMHGVVYLGLGNTPITPLITWQDRRCLDDATFLERLRDKTGYLLHTGYGLATLAWMQHHRKQPDGAVAVSTIPDLVVAQLCRLPRPVTDPSNAAAWGLFNLQALSWDGAALEALALPQSLLPVLRPFGSVVDVLDAAMATRLGLPEGIPVPVAVGDLHASLLATMRDPEHDIALNLGTGGQATVITAAPIEARESRLTWNTWPYPGGRFAVVAASLCGGAAWAWLAESLASWLRDLDIDPPPPEVLLDKLNTLGLEASGELVVHPHFLGERHDPARTGSVEGITLTNGSLGALARGLARSIVLNLRSMLPPEALIHRTGIIGSGNALRRTPLLQQMTEAVFGLPLTLQEGQEEAATGAALLAAGTV